MCARTLQSPQRIRYTRKRRIILISSLCAVLGIIVGVTIGLLRSDYFNVAQISVRGTLSLTDEKLSSSIEKFFSDTKSLFSHSRSWLAFSSGALEESLVRELPILKHVHVERNGFGNLSVDIIERQPFVQICKGSGNALVLPCYHADSEGFVFAPHVENDSIQPAHIKIGSTNHDDSNSDMSIAIGTYPLSIDQWKGIRDTMSAFESHGLLIDSILIVSSTTVRIDVGAFVVKAPLIEIDGYGPHRAAENVSSLLTHSFRWHRGMPLPQLDYIDARYGNSLFYRSLDGSTSGRNSRERE